MGRLGVNRGRTVSIEQVGFMASDTAVLIVGGGLTGLTAALLLASGA